MQVAIASRRLPVLESAASEIKAATGGTVLPVQVLHLVVRLFVVFCLFSFVMFVCLLPLR